MPDIRARPWFVRIAKMFGEDLSANDICQHAERIGIDNPNRLLGCIRDRGTDIARQIIRALYSKEKLVEKSGTEAVSDQRRNAIRSEYYVCSLNFFNKQICDNIFNLWNICTKLKLQTQIISENQFIVQHA